MNIIIKSLLIWFIFLTNIGSFYYYSFKSTTTENNFTFSLNNTLNVQDFQDKFGNLFFLGDQNSDYYYFDNSSETYHGKHQISFFFEFITIYIQTHFTIFTQKGKYDSTYMINFIKYYHFLDVFTEFNFTFFNNETNYYCHSIFENKISNLDETYNNVNVTLRIESPFILRKIFLLMESNVFEKFITKYYSNNY